MRRLTRLCAFAALPALVICTEEVRGADVPKEQPKQAKPAQPTKKRRYEAMDYGPYLAQSFVTWHNSDFDNGTGQHTGDCTPRAIMFKLSEDWADGIVFDQDTCRMSAGWLNGGIAFKGVIFGGDHGPNTNPKTPPTFETPNGPGWANAEGSFVDPRADNIKPLPRPGPLPKDWAKFRGVYRHGDKALLSYTVGASNVLELPGLEVSGDVKALVRTIRIDKSDRPMTLRIAAGKVMVPAGKMKQSEVLKDGAVDGLTATLAGERFAVAHAPAGAALEINNAKDLVLKLPASGSPVSFKVLITKDAPKEGFSDLAKNSPKPVDLAALTKGGPPQWPTPVVTKGVLSSDQKSAYVVDTITHPEKNPWESWMRTGGFDFFTSDPTRAAVCTWSGDVWIVSGIDDDLSEIKWKRFASGLHQPLGLKIVDDVIYTVGHDQITRFDDFNKDGEADFYENFNSDWQLTTAFHAFCFDLHTDPQGNFVFMFGSPVRGGGGGFHRITDHHGTVLKVTPNGQNLSVYATGFRAPNGMGVGPDGQVTSSDNQGTRVPATPLHWIKEGSFNGVSDAAHGRAVHVPKALCFFPQSIDNSGGGQIWVTSDKWGPLTGDLLHMSYGKSSIFKVMKEEVNGQMQGGCVKFPLKFTSSAMRARFNKGDGQLYVMGLSGWQSNAAKDGGFNRVRYTGKPVYMPKELAATQKGMRITFTAPLDAKSAADVANYSCEVWNYVWSGGYGSDEVSTLTAADPKAKPKKGRDPMTITLAKVSPDGKSVFLEIEEMRPCWNMLIKYNIKAADGTGMQAEVINTIHELGKE